jgi:hypothetical protein
MSNFSRAWLKLREPADLAARDAALARRFAAVLPRDLNRPVRIVDLGAGSGANCRAVMPRIAGDQEWILIDRDRDLIAAQADEFTLWARRQGYPTLAGGGRITMTVGANTWNVTSMPLDLALEPATLGQVDADAMTGAALFDLVSAPWLERFAEILAQRRLPLLAVLTVTGKRDWAPSLAEDAIVANSFRRHQASDKGFGAALGAVAAQTLAATLRAKGFAVSETASDWRLDARHDDLLAELIRGEAVAAREAAPDQEAAILRWQEERHKQLQMRKLQLTLGHCDMLALPE